MTAIRMIREANSNRSLFFICVSGAKTGRLFLRFARFVLILHAQNAPIIINNLYFYVQKQFQRTP